MSIELVPTERIEYSLPHKIRSEDPPIPPAHVINQALTDNSVGTDTLSGEVVPAIMEIPGSAIQELPPVDEVCSWFTLDR